MENLELHFNKKKELLTPEELADFRVALANRMSFDYPKGFFDSTLIDAVSNGEKIYFGNGGFRDSFMGMVNNKRYLTNDRILGQLIHEFFNGYDESLSLEQILDLFSENENAFGKPKSS